jgi:toxin ParE1/3/4
VIRRVVLRGEADRDLRGAFRHYRREAGSRVALAFLDAVEHTFQGIRRHPAAGSPHYGHELSLPGLRHRRVEGYPYLVFYVERDEGVDVWRILHAQRDIPAGLGGEGAD